MLEIYQNIWDLARPYYLKGRPKDIQHIEWMMKAAADVAAKDNLDESLLMPLVILHDVGYADIDSSNPFGVETKRLHMAKGAEIARSILDRVNYNSDKADQIVKYISVHDNWILGDNQVFLQDKILWAFNDLDFMWMATSHGFEENSRVLKKTPDEMINFLVTNEKILNRPWFSDTTKQMFESYIAERRVQK